MDLAPGLPTPSRRTVTILFTDVVGSTELAESLDPEVLRPALGAYFAACRTAIERHGGTVEKYIGDAVMAVFGIPAVHEDDALRAVRAALELHTAVDALAVALEPELGVVLRIRTGIQTGAVLAGGGAPGEPVATGDAVNTAARLQGVAPPGGIVLGEGSHRLVRAAVEADLLPPVELKGKAQPVAAWHVRGLRAPPAPEDRSDRSSLHGRATALAQLEDALRMAIATGEPRALAVVGEPGLGKSRLVARLLQSVAPGARTALTRVASYGEATFAPVGPLLARVSGAPPGADPGAVLARLERSLAGSGSAPEIAGHLASLLGLDPSPVRTEEVAWAVRVVLDSVAHQGPLVLVVEDLHWAEPGLAALVGHLAASLRGPILLVVTTRPTDPEVLGPGAGWTRLELDALRPGAAAAVVEEALGGPADAALSARLVALGHGNPLFLEQLVATLRDDGRLELSDGTWHARAELTSVSVPATVDALVAARFDRLAADGRALLEVIAVGGASVETPVVAAILGTPPATGTVDSLADTAFLEAPADGALTWRHVLVRDAVYGGIPKRRRATLHVAFADRLAGAGDSVTPPLELRVGHHLEAAVGYRHELRLAGPETDALARRGAGHLGAAGRRAFMAADMPAAADLLARAADLLPDDDPERAALLPDLGKARLEIGDPRARETIEEAVARTTAAGLTREHAHARLHRYVSAIWFERSVSGLSEREPLEAIARELEAAGDPRGAALAWSAVAEVDWFTGDLTGAVATTETAARLALAAGDLWAWREYLALSVGEAWGEWPVEVAVTRARAALAASGDHPMVAARALPVLGGGLALGGDVAAGRPLVHRGIELAREVGLRIWEVEMATVAGWFELMVGDPQAALRVAGRAHRVAAAIGDRPHLAAAAGVLALTCATLGRDEEAAAWAALSHENRPSDTSPTEVWWMTGLVVVHLRGGRTAEAEALAERALTIAGEVDADRRASAELAMAEVREAQGLADEARALRLAARARYERLGYRLLVDRIPADGGVHQRG